MSARYSEITGAEISGDGGESWHKLDGVKYAGVQEAPDMTDELTDEFKLCLRGLRDIKISFTGRIDETRPDFSSLEFLTAYMSVLDDTTKTGMVVTIIDSESRKPLASGVALLHKGEKPDPAYAERIAAKRACEDYARQQRRSDIFRASFARELYHEFRKRQYDEAKAMELEG